ncbi:MAG: chitobiase/beta-hexosaminidase C-terminal domain-containing protein [Bacteroidaceae bacterium]|nr:chitobiase/beta-hexosaminidase C-terminal domain-containing protein [Bacteroidaceae bacterium]
MDKTIGKWLSLLLLMFCAGNAAFAQKLTAEDFSIKAGESKYITIVYEGTEAMHGFQTDITLSEGLSCDDYPMGIALSFLNNSNKLGTNVYRVAGYNEEGGTASNGDGIIALTVKASDDFTGGTIKLTHTEISFEGDNAVNPEDLTINVTVEKEPVVEGDKYALFTGDIEPGDYIIYYDGKAMNSTIATNRLQYEEVTPVDNAIVNPSADIVWTIAKDGDNYTIYNAANKGYAASNGTKNQAAFATEVSDNARWTVSGTETYEFVNVANSAAGVNANLRNNGTYGFACYSTGTGGALTLYKKVEAGEVVKPVLTESQNFDSPLTIEITAEDGADIYYTTDGSTPTESSTKYTEPFLVVETTTVNAIAVKGGVTSEVATATYTRVNPILISEAQALDAGSEAYIVGACVASAANGAVLYDGSDYIYYYNNANDLEVGKYYSVNGILSSYGGANQFTAAADVKEHAPADLAIPTDVTELTATDLDAAVEAKVVDPRQLASITGTLAISGNYVNLTVDGTETSMGSIVKPKEDISAFDGKKVVVTGYEMYVNNKYVYFVATNIEEAPLVEEGIYYLYDENSKKFMSRGATWGTRAVVDNYGLAIELVLADGAYKLKTVDGQAFYGDNGDMYTDCTGDRERSYTVAAEGEGYTFTNTANAKPVFVTEEGFINNGDGTATVWKLLSQEERDEIVLARENAEVMAALEKAGIAADTPESKISFAEPTSLTFKTGSAWTFAPESARGARVATNDFGSEVFQGSGTFTQKVEGLEAGLYKVTIQAYYRDGANEAVAANYDKGYNLSLAYLDANGTNIQVLSWGKDRAADNNPNGMSEGAALFSQGKYINEGMAYVGEDGVLDLTLYQPNFIGSGWFMANEVTYAKVTVEETNAFAVFVDEELEGGTITAEPAEAEEGATITLTVTPEGDNKVEDVVAYYMVLSTNPDTGELDAEMQDIDVTAAEDGTYTFVMPAADAYVTATFRTKNEPGEYKDTPLTQDMFKGWDGFDDYAKVNNERPYWDADPVPGNFTAGKTVYGSGNVTNSDYADITGAQTMRINATQGMQFRVLINRQADNSLVELNPVVGEEGYVDVDLSEYEYVHVNAIKTGWGSSEGTIESIILNPSEEEEPIEGENWTFDENPDDVITVTTQGYQRNIPEGSDQITGLQPVTGWTPGEQDQSDPGFSAGIFKYGSENLLNNKVAAPAAAPEGSESPSALGLSAVWGGIAQYTQPITLQPGSYKYVYVLYNGANTGAVTKNLFGFIAEDGTEYLSDKTTFPVGEWNGGEVTFTLEEETTGNLSVGFIGGGGSGNAPHLFVDFIDLEKIDEADVAKDELEKAIEAAQAKEYVIGDELFQYPQSEIDPLDEAIAAAQAVYDNEDATVDEVNAATETLNNFIETFDPAYNEPEDGTPYIMTLTTSDGQFPLAIDGTANKIVEEGEETYIYFDKQEDGTWGMKTEDGDYIAYEGSNKWTMSTSTEPYGWTIEALKDGGVSVSGTNGLYGTNTSDGNAAGSAIYGDKTTANGNYIWNIKPAEQEPEGTLYNGTLTQTLAMPDGTVMGEEVDIDYDVFISAPDPNNGVQIQFVDGFTFPVMGTVVPDLIVDAQMTTNEDGSISYSSEPFTVSVPRGMMTVTFNATLTGTQENEKVNPVITLTLSQGPTTNTVVFGPREEGVFAVNIDEAIENGTVESDKATAKEGETVTLTVTPDEGFELDVLSVTYPETTMEADGTESTEMKEIEVTETADGYTFTMPAADALVSAIFKATEPGLPDYVFVATEWQAGDPARISADNVTVDETANTITVNKDGNQNVNLQFKGIDYNVPAENKYFVVQATGCTPDGAQLWWMNNDWIGTITPEVYTVGDEILYAWPLEVLKKNGGSGEPITLASDTDDALFNYNSQWSTCFGLTLADPNTPAVITNIGFTSQLPEIAVGINRISIDGADFAATIDNALRNGKVFDISGRKVNSVVKGGIYIVDGVKMVVRK